jgi:uncharacterized protein (TIGR02246 family)
MRTVLLSALLVALSAAPRAQAQDAAQERAIKQRCAEFATLWGKHKPKELASLWAEDGDDINPFGRVATGRAAVQKLMEEQHATAQKSSFYQLTVTSVHFVKPDIAVVDWDGMLHRMVGPDGNTMPPQKHHVVMVMTEKDGRWFFASARPGPFTPAASK